MFRLVSLDPDKIVKVYNQYVKVRYEIGDRESDSGGQDDDDDGIITGEDLFYLKYILGRKR